MMHVCCVWYDPRDVLRVVMCEMNVGYMRDYYVIDSLEDEEARHMKKRGMMSDCDGIGDVI